MERLKGNLLYGQSGGPTSVINASAYGVIREAFKNKDIIGEVYCMKHGIHGVLHDQLVKISDLDPEQIELLVNTPGAAFGTIRYKMKQWEDDESEYIRIVEILKKYDIRYFLYNGGNDSMETCFEVDEYLKHIGYSCRVIGIPKTIDNDLPVTDHCPGYGSAAKYIANACMEIACDSSAYPKGKVTIAEIMGRHTGWLTAASYVATASKFGPDLIYLPEIPFSTEQFKEDIRRVMQKKDHFLVAVSEGIHDVFGNFIAASSGSKTLSVTPNSAVSAINSPRSFPMNSAIRPARANCRCYSGAPPICRAALMSGKPSMSAAMASATPSPARPRSWSACAGNRDRPIGFNTLPIL